MKTRKKAPQTIAMLGALSAGILVTPILLPAPVRADVRRDDFRLQADLIEAARQGDSVLVRSLLGKGAGVETRDPQNGWTPLMWAARGGHVATVRVLLARGAKVNQRSLGDTRTYMVLTEGPTRGAAVDAATGTGAGRSGRFGSANNGLTPLILASVGGFNLAAKELLAKGAEVNARSSSGETALMAAAFTGYLPLVRTLLARGARVSDRDLQGHTALASAVLEGHTLVVRELLKHGAPANDLYMKQTPLVTVARYYHYNEIATLLRRHGAREIVKTTKTGVRKGAAKTSGAKTNPSPAPRQKGAPPAYGPNVVILN